MKTNPRIDSIESAKKVDPIASNKKSPSQWPGLFLEVLIL
tara:strand:+ start:183 stop:302 length:120 start_codon:yes stop_codon:yes gene_type:complete